MYVPCILSDSVVWTWFKSMRTLFGHLKKKSGQAVKAHTARQKWTMSNFQFLSAHLCIRPDTSQFGRVSTPMLQDDDAASVTSSQAPSQLPRTSQAGPSQAPRDRRPRAASSTGTGKRVDKAILKLADHLSQNTGVQDQLQSAVQESGKPPVAFCQWMGLEMMSKLDEELWTGFMCEAFDLVAHYRQLQTQQLAPPPPPPQAVQQTSVQPQPYQPSVPPWSAPPLPSPPFWQQMDPAWQPGPSTEFNQGYEYNI